MSSQEKRTAIFYSLVSVFLLLVYVYFWGTSGELFYYLVSMYLFATFFILLYILGFLKRE